MTSLRLPIVARTSSRLGWLDFPTSYFGYLSTASEKTVVVLILDLIFVYDFNIYRFTAIESRKGWFFGSLKTHLGELEGQFETMVQLWVFTSNTIWFVNVVGRSGLIDQSVANRSSRQIVCRRQEKCTHSRDHWSLHTCYLLVRPYGPSSRSRARAGIQTSTNLASSSAMEALPANTSCLVEISWHSGILWRGGSHFKRYG